MNDITILYVEDDEYIRDGLEDILKYLSKELYIAIDGKDGLEKYKKHNPDIIISDIKMPRMNGIEMVKAIKNIDKKQHVIFTTAHSESSYFMEAIEAQVDGYILKPIDFDLLEEKIEEIAGYIKLKKDYKQQQLLLIQNEKMVSMGEMIGNIAHQWRQPLSVISTSATGILMQQEYGTLTDENLILLCNVINDNSQYLSQTIDDFRDYIKGDNKKIEFMFDSYIKSFLNIIDATVINNNIKLIINIPENIKFQGYPNQLNQCFMNIFNNAKDVLKMNDIENKLFFIDLEENDKNIVIVLKDNGGGIDKEIIDKIFEPYFTTKHKSRGTGLGLHMTYNMIESMGGQIYVSNESFKYENQNYLGASFKIILPKID